MIMGVTTFKMMKNSGSNIIASKLVSKLNQTLQPSALTGHTLLSQGYQTSSLSSISLIKRQFSEYNLQMRMKKQI